MSSPTSRIELASDWLGRIHAFGAEQFIQGSIQNHPRRLDAAVQGDDFWYPARQPRLSRPYRRDPTAALYSRAGISASTRTEF